MNRHIIILKKNSSLLTLSLLITIMGCGAGGVTTNELKTAPPPTQYGNRSITFTLTPPTEYMDSTLVGPGEIAGYHVYCGISPGSYSSNPVVLPGTASGTVTTTIQAAIGRTNYCVVTAYDGNGIESGHSNEMSKLIN